MCLCECMPSVWKFPQNSEESIGFHRAGVVGGCEPSTWELNFVPLEKQQITFNQ